MKSGDFGTEMADWLEEDDDGPAAERAAREREYEALASRMATLGFQDGVEAGQEMALQSAFDRGYGEGFRGVESDAVRMASTLSTFVEFYARHGAALGVPVSLAALVFGEAPKLPRDDILRRLARLLSDSAEAASASDAERWARLFSWADASGAEFTPKQLDVAMDAAISGAGPSLNSVHRPVSDAAGGSNAVHDHRGHSGCS
jgi:hypothetical protein